MEDAAPAIIGAAGTITAAALTAWVALKISNAKGRAAANTDHAEEIIKSLWTIIDRVRLDNARLSATNARVTAERDKLREKYELPEGE